MVLHSQETEKAMNLKSISNEELNRKLKSLVHQERELLSEILLHIAEVDRRKLYLKMAHPNLFSYLTEHLGYSAGSAQRRIDAARLLQEVPDVISKLETGELSLAHVSLVQKSIRQKNIPVSKEDKQVLVAEISGKSLEDSQKLVAKALDLEIKEAPRAQIQKDGSMRFEVTFTKEQWEKLLQMRELLSTSLPHGSWDKVLEYVADKMIQKQTKAQAPQPSKHVTVAKKKFVLRRDRCCQYEDPITKKQCGSRWNLQIDHIEPRWAGGSNELENLRLLCALHNRSRYREQAGFH